MRVWSSRQHPGQHWLHWLDIWISGYLVWGYLDIKCSSHTAWAPVGRVSDSLDSRPAVYTWHRTLHQPSGKQHSLSSEELQGGLILGLEGNWLIYCKNSQNSKVLKYGKSTFPRWCWETLGFGFLSEKWEVRNICPGGRFLSLSTCVDKCSDPPKLSFGSMGKQHQSMNATKATLVPTRRMKSSIDWKKSSVLIKWTY